MNREERIVGLLGIIDEMTSESKKPAPLSKLIKKTVVPRPTVYMLVDMAEKRGLVTKTGDRSYKYVALTLQGYRLLGKEGPVSVPGPQKDGFTYKDAYLLLSRVFIAGEALGAPERRVLSESIKSLVTE